MQDAQGSSMAMSRTSTRKSEAPGTRCWCRPLVVTALLVTAACTEDDAVAPPPVEEVAFSHNRSNAHAVLADSVRTLASGRSIGPLSRPRRVRRELVRLGQALLFDPILSGNRDIACMTCHHPTLATGDVRHLSIGQGAKGLGPRRVHPQGEFIPRNAPPLFNLHAMDALFWDGRVSVDANGQFTTPAGPLLTPGMTKVFEFGAVSALGLFPVTSREEMRAFRGNELARIPDSDLQQIWAALMKRLDGIPLYRKMFEAAYPGTRFRSMTFAHASNAMAGFMVDRLAFNRAPWDRFLHGDDWALTSQQLRGAHVFMEQSCSICHGGPAFSTGGFANVAVAQLGPGQGDGPSSHDDFGRERVTGDPADRYKFRTTPLRNVELTGPYGHAGQFVKLRDFVDHYSDSDKKLFNYDATQLEPLLQKTVLMTFDEIPTTRSGLLNGLVLTDTQIDELTAFMIALTDPAARQLDHLVPFRVPSGLPIDR